MATLAVTQVSRTGPLDVAAIATAAAGGGDKWINTGAEIFYVNNAGGSPCVVTWVFNAQQAIDGQVPANKTVSVAGGKSGIFGGFPTGLFNDANQFMNVTYNQVTTVTVAVLRYVNT
jgi:hypothetical protein